MKVRLNHLATICLLVIILLIAAISTLSSPQHVLAQDEMTATVTGTFGSPPTIPFLSTMTPTVTATMTAKPTITATTTVTATVTATVETVPPTATGTPTDKPTVTATITQKPTLTTTPTATWKPTVTSTITATVTSFVQTYIVSGTLGVKGAGATVWYSGGFTIADGLGNYSIAVPSGWEGVITPTKTGYRFSPDSIAITSPVIADLPDQNFTTKPSKK